jgi:sensor domain CHASE-containing protein
MTPQGVVRSFYPLKGNEVALQHNLLKGEAAGVWLQAAGRLSVEPNAMGFTLNLVNCCCCCCCCCWCCWCCCGCPADPERRGAALATIKNGNLTMQGPVMLKQGFRAAVARTPVFISNVSEDEFFGWVGVGV